MARGIDGRRIFLDDADRREFRRRLGLLLPAADTRCYGWALMSNHVHMVIQTGTVPLWRVMKRLNSGFAQHFNRRHERRGYLFQDRYRSRLVDTDADLMGVTRYVHLNPLRGGLVDALSELEAYSWCGYGALLGVRSPHPFESVSWVENLFGPGSSRSRPALREWMQTEVDCDGPSPLEPEIAGCAPASSTTERESTPVRCVPRQSVAEVIDYVCRIRGLLPDQLATRERPRKIADARAAIAFIAVIENGCRTLEVAEALALTPSAISHAVGRGRRVVAAEREGNIPAPKPG
jgi:REP element-mobilizing transposase RayT